MKAADKLIAIALAAGSLLFLGWLALRFFLPATLPFWLGLAIAALLRPVSLLFSGWNWQAKTLSFSTEA